MGNREEWLQGAAEVLVKDYIYARAGLGGILRYNVSVGFPKGQSGRVKLIGQCFDGQVALDGKANIFICPTQAEPTRVLDILLHELIHAATPGEKHGKGFIRAAVAVGLVRPWTGTTAGPELKIELEGLAELLGPYPHGAMVMQERGKKGSNLKLWRCTCGIKVRIGKKAADAFDATCNLCGNTFERQF